MKILVVDDDKLMVLLLTRTVMRLGHDVISAESGEEAIELIEDQLPDLVISDLMLPAISGMEIKSYLNNFTQKEIPFILLTASSEKIEQAGTCLLKPVSLQTLKNKIEELSTIQMYNQGILRA